MEREDLQSKNIKEKISQAITDLKKNASLNKETHLKLLEEIKYFLEKSITEDSRQYIDIFKYNLHPASILKAIDEGENFIIEDINLACEKMEKIKHEDVIGEKIRDIYPDIANNKLHKFLKAVWKTGKSSRLSYPIYKDDEIKNWRESKIFRLPSWKIVLTSRDITEEKNAEKKIKESVRKYRSLFENPKLVMLVIDFNTQEIVDANQGAELFYGWSRDEFKKMKMNQVNVLPPDEIQRRMKEAEEKKIPYFEFRHRKKDGSKVNVAVFKGNNIIIQGRKIFYIIVLDITEKEKAEIKLRKSEDLLLTTLYSIGDAVITTDKKGMVIRMNPVAERLTGWSEKEVQGKFLINIFNIINQDTREKVQNPVVRVLSEGTVIGLSNHTLLISKDGKEIPISDSGAPIKDEKGIIYGVILVFRDNTQEVKAKKLIRESEQRYRTLFDSGTDAIFVHPYRESGFGKFIEVNKVACDRLGYTREELLNITATDISDPKDAELRGSADIRRRAINEWNMIFETVHITKSGKKIPVEIYSNFVEFQNSKVIFSIARDITERKQAENELKRRMSELERSNKTMVGRELRMIGLKKEVNKLLEKLGKPKKYRTDQDN